MVMALLQSNDRPVRSIAPVIAAGPTEGFEPSWFFSAEELEILL
jgi:hypothetical protein